MYIYIYIYVLSCMNCLHVLEMNSLFLNLVANIFFLHFEVCLLLSFGVFRAVEKLLRLMRSLLLSFALIFPLVRVDPKRTCCDLCQSVFCVYFPREV